MNKLYSLFLPMALQNPQADLIKVTATLSQATWNTIAAHEILQVTGDVRILMLPKIRQALAGAGLTIALGIEGATSAWIAATGVAAMLVDTVWLSTTPAKTFATGSLLDRIVSGGADVGYTIAVGAGTGGIIDFYCWWEALTPGSTVQAGLGGAL